MAIKVLAMSDLHVEFAPFHYPIDDQPDLIVLAGDISHGEAGVSLAKNSFPGSCPKIVTCGNHEFYQDDYDDVLRRCRQVAMGEDNVHFLERDQLIVPVRNESVRVLGCILWTDFGANGADRRRQAIVAAGRMMNDFRLIRFRDRFLLPEDTIELHQASVAWLEERLSEPHDGPTIVVTHHAPSSRSQPPQFVDGPLAPAFVSDLDDLIRRYQPDLWIHGHTHWSVDYHIGRTRVYSNQRGYPGEDCGFRRELIRI